MKLAKIPSRTLKDGVNRIVGQGNLVAGAIRNLENKANKWILRALQLWKLYVGKCKEGQLMDAVRAQQLKGLLANIPIRTLRLSYNEIMKDSRSLYNKLRLLHHLCARGARDALDIWKQVKQAEKAVTTVNKARKMKNALKKPTKKAIRSARDRTTPDLVGVQKLKAFAQRLIRRPRDALNLWKDYVKNVKQGALLDNIKARQLEKMLKNIPLRTSKDAVNRIVGEGDKVAGALRSLESKIKQIPRQALSLWKKYNQDAKTGKILDNLRAQKLKDHLQKIVMRTIKGGNLSIVLYENKVRTVVGKLD